MKKILSTRVLVKICVLTTILLVLIIYTIWGNSALMVSLVNISSDRIPSAFSNFRIAQVSDLHNAEFGESNTELIELLSEHEPDIIVITGDLIDAGASLNISPLIVKSESESQIRVIISLLCTNCIASSSRTVTPDASSPVLN